MIRSGEEILADIDATLDQLIKNAEVMRHDTIEICDTEIEALQKTQESLLARLIHMDQLLDGEKIPVRKKPAAYENMQQKLQRFGKLNSKLINNVAHRFAAKKMQVRKSRKKKASATGSKN